MAVVLDASTLVLMNIYIIMGFQLGFNWNQTNCNQNGYYFQLGFIGLMALRLFFHELYHNFCFNKAPAVIFNFLLSGLLVALSVIFALRIANNPNDFHFDPATLAGSEICYQNRIVFVAEMIIVGLTVLKDIYFTCCGGQREEAEVKPS